MWNIKQTEEFQEWFDSCNKKLQVDIVEYVEILRQMGPQLGRPHADTIKGSSLTNLKELRFNSGQKVIRIFLYLIQTAMGFFSLVEIKRVVETKIFII